VPTLLRLAETFQVPVGELISGIGEIDGDELKPKSAIDSKRSKEVSRPRSAGVQEMTLTARKELRRGSRLGAAALNFASTTKRVDGDVF